MNFKKKISICALVIVLLLGFGVSTIPQPALEKGTCSFVIASWAYPDEYGQGIDGMKFWENSTGSWVAAPYYTSIGQFFYVNYYITEYTYNLTSGTALKMRVDSFLNNTLVGAADLADGQNYLRHTVSVRGINGTVIFSQSNFTYSDGSDLSDPIFYYEYDVVLNFITIQGEIYRITVTHEVYY